MKYEVFFTALIKYYKKQENEYVFMVTEKYIKSRFKEDRLIDLMTSLYENHPAKYGFPDICAIKSAVVEYEKMKVEEKKEIEQSKEKILYKQDFSLSEEERSEGLKMLSNLSKAVELDKLAESKNVKNEKQFDPNDIPESVYAELESMKQNKKTNNSEDLF